MYGEPTIARGDIVTSERFRYTSAPNPHRKQNLAQIGTDMLCDKDDPGAATAKFYIAHVPPIIGYGDGPGASQVITALRLDGDRAGEAVQFECTAVCHERMSGQDLKVVACRFLAPVKPNCILRLKAASESEAQLASVSIYGFVPTALPVRGGGSQNWNVAGYQYDKLFYPQVNGVSDLPS